MADVIENLKGVFDFKYSSFLESKSAQERLYDSEIDQPYGEIQDELSDIQHQQEPEERKTASENESLHPNTFKSVGNMLSSIFQG